MGGDGLPLKPGKRRAAKTQHPLELVEFTQPASVEGHHLKWAEDGPIFDLVGIVNLLQRPFRVLGGNDVNPGHLSFMRLLVMLEWFESILGFTTIADRGGSLLGFKREPEWQRDQQSAADHVSDADRDDVPYERC